MQSAKLEEAVSAVDMPGGQAVQELEYSSSQNIKHNAESNGYELHIEITMA
jgi:hypothetical protein